ncbi:MAG: response regulator [Paracoccus sp. (in: a-proteobacteria)]|nr:response regulator [Paracoccus sp. (in: a-proteobacteria)]
MTTRTIRTLLVRYLSGQGFRVQGAGNRRECLTGIAHGLPDLVVLDVRLPDGSGLEICRDLRARHRHLPIIMLTALKEDVDRIIGLEIGADDHLGKPFNPREMVARMKAVLRRPKSEPVSGPDPARRYVMAGFTIDVEARSVTACNGRVVDLTFDFLRMFLDRAGRLWSLDQLLALTQGRDSNPLDRSIDVLMSRVRRKLGEKLDVPAFKTERKGGYQLILPFSADAVSR